MSQVNAFWELFKHWCKPAFYLGDEFDPPIAAFRVTELFEADLSEITTTCLDRVENLDDIKEVVLDLKDLIYYIYLRNTEFAVCAIQNQLNLEVTTKFYPLSLRDWELSRREIEQLINDFVDSRQWFIQNNQICCKEKEE